MNYYIFKTLPEIEVTAESLMNEVLDANKDLLPEDEREIYFICSSQQLEQIDNLLSKSKYSFSIGETIEHSQAVYMGIKIHFINNKNPLKLIKPN